MWYKMCKEQHRKCSATILNHTGGNDWLPTRLIDTGDKDAADPNHLSIAETSTFSGSVRQGISYLALSHCWGKRGPSLRLTRDNKAILEGGFSIDDLPRTFRDAVNTTRRLGFRYIWIDSLCIIQDDEDDWTREALTMSEVYLNAEISLAADDSRNSDEGFFRHRNPGSFETISIDLLLRPFETGDGSATLTKFFACCMENEPMRLWDTNVEWSALSRRGWALQERILAPRTIHFTQEQICWECKELQALETTPKDSQKTWHHEREREQGVFNFKDWEPTPDWSARTMEQYMCTLWHGVVRTYTSCEPLTKESDKLIAVSGVAKALSKYLGSEYYAGLWGQTLLWDLLWRPGSSESVRKPQEYLAPTWSWASVEDVFWLTNYVCQEPLVIIQRVFVDTVSGDSMGQVKYAELDILGHLVPCEPHWWSYYDLQLDSRSSQWQEGKFFLLPLLIEEEGKRKIKTTPWLTGLLLERIDETGTTKYQRCGVFQLRASGWLDDDEEVVTIV